MTGTLPSPPSSTGSDPDVWDVAVVGAGPAGASAALAAARAGRTVVLLEKAALPRYKTCGGGIIGPSAGALPSGFELPVRDSIRAVEFTYNSRFRRIRRSPRPLFRVVNRAEFDEALTGAATDAGAVLRQETTVQKITDEGDTVVLALGDGTVLRARALVGADGSASRAAAHVGVRIGQVDLGLESEIPVPPEIAALWRGRVLIDWGPLPGSYGWVFPKGDTLTVGVIHARGEGARTKEYLRDFIARLGLAGFEPSVSSGHLTRCREDGSPLARGRVLVAGDAAGLLEPWTREGISYALRSGRAAGEAAAAVAGGTRSQDVAAAAEVYRREVEDTLGREMRAGRLLLDAFEKRPLAFHGAIAVLPKAWHAFERFVRGDLDFAEAVDRRGARRMLELAGR